MGKLSKQQQNLIAAVVVFCGFIYGYWNYLLKPTLGLISTRQTQYNDLVRKIEVAELQARRLPQLQAEYAKLQTDLASMEKQLPTDKDFPGILRLITREATEESLNFVGLRPLDPRRDNFFDVLEFEVNLTGTLQSFVRFMSALGQQERIFQFDRMTMNSTSSGPDASSGNTQLNISFMLRTYAYAG